jgi:hypothetical protein
MHKSLILAIILLLGYPTHLAQQISFTNMSKTQTSNDHDKDNDNDDKNDNDNDESDSGSKDDDKDDGDDDDDDKDDGDSGDSDDGSKDNDDNNSGSGNSNDDDNDDSDNSGDQNKDDDKNSDDHNKDDDKDQKKDDDFDDDHQYYVGTVSANDGQSVIVDGSSFKGNSPWLKILNIGMLLEAYGKWENGSFLVTDIQVLMPARFAYYQGPAALFGQGEGIIEAWINEQKRLESSRPLSTADNSVTLIAYFDGTKLQATPDNIPIPQGLGAGWVELRGSFDGSALTWESFRSFPY